MKASSTLTLCCTALLLATVSCKRGGFKILGGYYDVHDSESNEKIAVHAKWGDYSPGPDRKTITIVDSQCWASIVRRCYMKLVVSTLNSPNITHYQILGAKTYVMDRASKHHYETFGWGQQEASNGIEENIVAHGYIWSDRAGAWGYSYLHLFVEQTTRPSLTNAFSMEERHKDLDLFPDDQLQFGQRAAWSSPYLLCRFRTHSAQWGDTAEYYTTVYIAQTKCVGYTAVYEEKTVKQVGKSLQTSFTLENHGSAVTADGFSKIRSPEALDTTPLIEMSTAFPFQVDVGNSVTLDISFLSAPLNLNLHSGQEITSEKISTPAVTHTIEWPSECPAGLRITNSIYKTSVRHSIPVEFTFERLGQRWKERKTLSAVVYSLVQEHTNCCLHPKADARCGKPDLSMCSTSFESDSEFDFGSGRLWFR